MSCNIRNEVSEMKKDLEVIQVLIRDADRMGEAEEETRDEEIKREQVKVLRQVAFRMEDVIDEYKICEEQHQHGDLGCAALLKCQPIINFIKTTILRLSILHKIQSIKSHLREIDERSFLTLNQGRGGSRQKHQMPLLWEEYESVGLEASTIQFCEPKGSPENRSILRQEHQMPLYREEDEIVDSVASTNQSCRRDGSPESTSILPQKHQMTLYREKDEFVGLEASRMEVVSFLLEERAERTVTCVTGMGGMGKTTLARGVFVHEEVIKHFECRAWITVSQSYTVKGLLREILHKFCKEKMKHLLSEMNEEMLIDEVRNYLRHRRYVIFFDDVWDTRFWDEIEFIAIDNNNGSRILITTRSKNVAYSCMKSSFVNIYELAFLNSEQSWKLFCKKAFGFEFDGHCPPELELVSSQIVEKCMGNPLVIVTVAGLISAQEKSVAKLKHFSDSLMAKFESNSFLTDATKIIGLSYDDLPYYLKSCLLYFGMYPDDYEVESERLVMQWIAEGFVKYEEGKTSSEEVAEQYLVELINRNLVQVSSLTYEGKVKGVRVHNLIRSMILKQCKDSKFCHYVGEDIYQPDLNGEIRRLSIATNFDDSMGSSETSSIRSLLFFTSKELSAQFIRKIPAKYRLLRVLDFENAQLDCVPENLEKLFHLKYLSFRNTQVKSLPKSIGMLQNLETLDVRQTHVHVMPKEISMLEKLRHLLADEMSLILLKGRIGGLTSLQTLCEVHIDSDGVGLITELGKLSQLKKLGMANVMREHASDICSSVNKMMQLEKLYISTEDGDEAIEQDIGDVLTHERLTVLVNGKNLPK